MSVAETYASTLALFLAAWHAKFEKEGLSEDDMESKTAQSIQHFWKYSRSSRSVSRSAGSRVETDSDDNGTDVVHSASPDAPGLVAALEKIGAKRATLRAGANQDALGQLAAAARLQQRRFPEGVSAHDVQILGVALLGDLFGPPGQKRLVAALKQLYAPQADHTLARALEVMAGAVAERNNQAGAAKVASFASRLGRVVKHDDEEPTTAEGIQIMDTKVKLVRQWQRWSHPAAADKEIASFLDSEGIPARAGVVLASRIVQYVAREAQIDAKKLPKKIYAWKPLAILDDLFGTGVLALAPSSMLTAYSRLRHHKDGLAKEARFRAVVTAAIEELPVLCEICQSCNDSVVQPILASAGQRPMLQADASVPGIRMARSGELDQLQDASLYDLFFTAPARRLPIGSVEELDESDRDDALVKVRARESL
jgi:hypothetical protein